MSAEKVAELARDLAGKSGRIGCIVDVSVYDAMALTLSNGGREVKRVMSVYPSSEQTGRIHISGIGWTTVDRIEKYGNHLMTREEYQKSIT